MNLNDLNMTPPAVEIPKKQKIKKKAKEQPVLTMKDIPAPDVYKRQTMSRESWTITGPPALPIKRYRYWDPPIIWRTSWHPIRWTK